MGDDHVSIGFVVGLDWRDAALSGHDLLQEFKTHPMIKKLLEGGERVSWGAKTIPEGGWLAMPKQLAVPGAMLVGDTAGLVNVAKLKGVHYAIKSGMLASDAILEHLNGGGTLAEAPALMSYDKSVREGQIGKDLYEVRNAKQVFHKGFFVGGFLANLITMTKGKFPGKNRINVSDADYELFNSGRTFPAADGKLTFDKLSSVFISGNKTRDDQPNHIRIQENVPKLVAESWVNMCPAAVYEIDEDAAGGDTVTVKMAPSNCVHCGAITAKGGRLTPPEGGSGPEYQLL
jgi:electron-transferring-flavoprotein dehydrogenase